MNDVVALPPLSPNDDTFCLAVIEYGGNLGAAYRAAYGKDAPLPIARARELITRPEIAKRIHQLTVATEEHALISLGSHLVKLAEIRDECMETKYYKVALQAEVKRAEAVGIYQDKVAKSPSGSSQTPMVQINIGSTPANIQDWATQHGTNAPMVVELPHG